MNDAVRARLESAFQSLQVTDRIHAVPPHAVYEVVVNGRRAVLKLDVGRTGSAGTEGRVIEFVGNQTSVAVPEIILVEDDFFVAEWEPQAPAATANHTADPAWARAAGEGLATLHAETAPLLGGYGPFRGGESGLSVETHDHWIDAVRDYIQRRGAVLARYGHDDIANSVSAVFDGRSDAFAGTGGPVCCHGWASPEHVAVNNGEVACMIDFEHAMAAPAEFDFWRTVYPVFGPTGGGTAREAFQDGYESVRPLPDGLGRRKPFYALLNGLYFLESLYVQDEYGPDETAEKADRFRSSLRDVWTEIDHST